MPDVRLYAHVHPTTGAVDVVEAADAAVLAREDGTLETTIKHAQVINIFSAG
jgi:hypothetical protein